MEFGVSWLTPKSRMGLAVLVFLVASYGVFKLWLQKRRTKKITRVSTTLPSSPSPSTRLTRPEALEAKALDEEGRMEQAWLKCTDAEVEEGDLFGIRAIERGFYGGVAQSRGPTPSATSVSSATLGRIPYGKDASRGIAANPSTIALDPGLGLGHGPGPSPPKAGATSKPLPAASAAADTCLRVPESPRVHPAQPAVSSPLLHGSTLSGSSVSTLGLPEEAVSESAGSGGGGGDDGCRSGIRQPPGPAVAKPPRAARPASPGFPLRKYLDPLPHPSAAIALALGDPAYPPGIVAVQFRVTGGGGLANGAQVRRIMHMPAATATATAAATTPSRRLAMSAGPPTLPGRRPCRLTICTTRTTTPGGCPPLEPCPCPREPTRAPGITATRGDRPGR